MTVDDWMKLKQGDIIVGPCGTPRCVVLGPGDKDRWKSNVIVKKIRTSWAIGSPNTYLAKEQARLYERYEPGPPNYIGEGI